MLTQEQVLQQLSQFFILKPLINQMRRLNEPSENTIAIVESLQNQFKAYFNQPDAEQYIRSYLSLKDVTYEALVVLTALKPLNDINLDGQYLDPISFEPIDSDLSVAFSTGYLYNLNTILSWRTRSDSFTEPTTGIDYSMQDRVSLINIIQTKSIEGQVIKREELAYLDAKRERERSYLAIAPQVGLPIITSLPANIQDNIRFKQSIIQDIERNQCSACLYKSPHILQAEIAQIFEEYRLKEVARRALQRAQNLLTAHQVDIEELTEAWHIAYDSAITSSEFTKKNYQLFDCLLLIVIAHGMLLPFLVLLSIEEEKTATNILCAAWYTSVFTLWSISIRDYAKKGSETLTAVTNAVREAQDARLNTLTIRHSGLCFFQSPIIISVSLPEQENLVPRGTIEMV